MHNKTESSSALSDIEAQYLRILLYFDIFSHPLTQGELLAYACGEHGDSSSGQGAISALVERGVINQQGSYLFLPNNTDGVRLREEKNKRAQSMWPKVPLSVKLLSAFPFVRGLSITGTLAKDAVGDDADIDFVVFTEEDRVWLCRTFIATTRRLLPHDIRQLCCTNVYLSENHLAYDQQTAYVATEIGLSRPVYGSTIGASFFHSNSWLKEYLPGLSQPHSPPISLEDRTRPPRLTRRIEKLLSGSLGDSLEAKLPKVWNAFWSRKYKGLDAEERKRRFRMKRSVSTNHYNNFQARVLEQYHKRLSQHGLTEPQTPPQTPLP